MANPTDPTALTDLILRHRSAATGHRATITNLEAQHGTGVRPAWVGEEIGWEAMQERQHLDEAARLEALRDGARHPEDRGVLGQQWLQDQIARAAQQAQRPAADHRGDEDG